jgi:hypothetical protein
MPRRIGYVDESYKLDPRGDLVYVLGQVDSARPAEELRAALRDLLLNGQDALRFSKERPERRVELAMALQALDFRMTAIVCRSERRAERARGLCVRDLAWAAQGRLSDLHFEARDPRQNAHDASILSGLRSQGITLSCSFLRKDEEPLLWAADLVAGAIRESIADMVGKAAEALGSVDCFEVH